MHGIARKVINLGAFVGFYSFGAFGNGLEYNVWRVGIQLVSVWRGWDTTCERLFRTVVSKAPTLGNSGPHHGHLGTTFFQTQIIETSD